MEQIGLFDIDKKMEDAITNGIKNILFVVKNYENINPTIEEWFEKNNEYKICFVPDPFDYIVIDGEIEKTEGICAIPDEKLNQLNNDKSVLFVKNLGYGIKKLDQLFTIATQRTFTNSMGSLGEKTFDLSKLKLFIGTTFAIPEHESENANNINYFRENYEILPPYYYDCFDAVYLVRVSKEDTQRAMAKRTMEFFIKNGKTPPEKIVDMANGL